MTGGLVCTVSTVKDTLPRVQRFVAGNLAGGVDHLFVLLDGAGPDVRAWCDDHPHVTCIRTDQAWWQGSRPKQLNERQRINANAVQAALREVGCADWLFHIDGDEVAQIDRDRLAGAPPTTPAARLGVLESVAQAQWDGWPTWFKRPLTEDELSLVATLGIIDAPRQGAYFHGHAEGKTGVRPGAGAWLTLHDPIDEEARGVDTWVDPSLRVLHYESYSGEEFVRKWMALIDAGPALRLRPGRQGTQGAVRALRDLALPPEVTERYLLRIFEETTADDFDALQELGLLVEADPDRGTHQPAALDGATRSALDRAVVAVTAEPKSSFRPPAKRPIDRDGEPHATDRPLAKAMRRLRPR
ncbi:glycosyltransferase family 2 protein [Nocardioides panacisoli]|uniref:glycosyltransferase family 2 protein n=1 Tax=Nocardioides panacisoli TaxID=627624 RepID=UPI001C624EE1|nr:glycosyltransferase family 2 protein [Nocardioides panacisoli]QYJ03747.1 glycosyltransferase family 2 protein [Nocardioides panacisoli]